MSEYGTTTKGVTARKRWRCDETSWTNLHFIAPGHRYLRYVAFPGSDVNGGDVPWVFRECVECADRRGRPGIDACMTFCCGDVPCALPFKHDGDRHSCRRCVVAVTR